MARIISILFSIALLTLGFNRSSAQNGAGPYDTLTVSGLIVGADTFPMLWIDMVEVNGKSKMDPRRKAELDRLRYNVYKVYPYAITAAYVLDDVDRELAKRSKKKDRKAFLKQKEQQLNSKFKGELKDLTMTQGQILVKLINRQTGKDCYNIIKEMKGGFNARVYQTVAFFFDNDLKRQYDPFNKDKDIEVIVQEIEAKNYFRYQVLQQQKRLNN